MALSAQKLDVIVPGVEQSGYTIRIGRGMLGGLWDEIRSRWPKLNPFIVTDAELVEAGHLQTLVGSETVPTYIIEPAGEISKHIQTVVEIEDVCPIIELPPTWDEYLMMLSKKQRHEVRRKLRKADAEADTRFYIVGPEQELQDEVQTFIDLHQKSTPEKDQFMDPQMQGFFFEVTQVLQDQGWLQLAFVEMDGYKAAALLNFDYADSILVYNSGYDPARFRQLSPGIIVTARCIEQAIALGRTKFDFLRGDEVYKYRFGAQDTKVRRLLVARPGTKLDVAC